MILKTENKNKKNVIGRGLTLSSTNRSGLLVIDRATRKCGFTIIEFLIVFAILITMIATALGFAAQNRNRKDLELATREVAANLRQVQNYAMGGKFFSGASTDLICGFWFYWERPHNWNAGLGFEYKTGFFRKKMSGCGPPPATDPCPCPIADFDKSAVDFDSATDIVLNNSFEIPPPGSNKFRLKAGLASGTNENQAIYFSVPFGTTFISNDNAPGQRFDASGGNFRFAKMDPGDPNLGMAEIDLMAQADFVSQANFANAVAAGKISRICMNQLGVIVEVKAEANNSCPIL